MSRLTPEQRTERARIAGLTTAMTRTGAEMSQPARAAFVEKLEARLLDEVDPERVLPEDERARRVEAARKLYFTRLSFKASRARQANAERRLAEQDDVAS